MQTESKQVTKKTWLGIIIAIVLMAATVAISYKMGDTKYYVASVLCIFYAMIPFVMGFENRKPMPREMVTIAVLTALAVISRVIFIAIPFCKPVIGVIFIAGMGMGAGSGFMVGALTAIVSDIICGQGPWTPWQMLAFGLAGFIGGVLCRKGLIKGDKPLVPAIISGLLCIIVVGPILDTSTLLVMSNMVDTTSAGAVYLSGLPVNAVLGAATFVTVLVLAKPMLEKLDRVKVKYGMMEEEE
ncbi:MAG: ECF transporter S component [Lachnospiraceae bacterium]|nr:ECF transporter S component [Candidatus Equihabitans merdae]